MDDFNFGQQQENEPANEPVNDFNFGAPQVDNAAQASNAFQFGEIQNSAPKEANDFNFEALPEIGSENIHQFNFKEKNKGVDLEKEPEKEGNFDDMLAEGIGAENNPNPPPKQLMPIVEEKKAEMVNSSPPKVEQAQQQYSQSILSQVGSAVGTSVFSLLSNVIAGSATEPESPAVLKRQSSVKQSPAQDQGFQFQNDKHQLSVKSNAISVHRPSSQVQQSPNIMQKSPVADQDDDADMQSDEDFVDEGVQFKNQSISASNRSHHKESLRVAPQVTETERQIDELKIILKAGKVVSWWSSIHTPADDVQVSNPFQHPLSYAQIEKTRDIKEMQNEMEALKHEVMVLKREKLEHQEQQDNLKHLSGKDTARVAELEFEMENHNAEMQQQKQQHLHDKQSVEDQYREEIEQLKSGAELQEQLHQALKQELQDEREKISNWEVQEQEFKDKIQSAVQQLTEQLSNCKEELKEKTRQVDNFDADKADLEKHVKNLQAQLEQEIAAKTDMEMDIQKLKVMFQSTTQSVAGQSIMNQSMASQQIDVKYFANDQGADESVNHSQAPSSAQGPQGPMNIIQQMQATIKQSEQRQSIQTTKDIPMNKLEYPAQSEMSNGNGLNVIHENGLLESLQKSDFQSIPDKLNEDDVAKLQKDVANANAGSQESYRDKFQTSQTAVTQMTQMSKIKSELPAQQLQQSALKNDSVHMVGNQDQAAVVQPPAQQASNQMPPNVYKQDSDPFASLIPAKPDPAPLPAIMPQMSQSQAPPAQPQVVPSQLLGVTPPASNQNAQQIAPPNQNSPQMASSNQTQPRGAPQNQNSHQPSPSVSSQPEQKMQTMNNQNNQPPGRQPNFQQIPGGGSSFVEQQRRAPSPFAQSSNQQNAQRSSSPFAQSMNQQMANKMSMGGLNPAGNAFAQQRQSVQVQSGALTSSLGGRPSAISSNSSNNPAQLPGPKPQPGASPIQPGGMQAPNAMAQQLQVNMQQQMLLAKLQSFHINSLLQGDKCVVYEDVNIKIGCVRQILYANGRINSLIKLFLRNHNTQNLNMNQVFLKVVNIKNPNLNNYIKISRSSQPLPLKVPQSKPLGPNQTIDLDVQLQWICDNSVQGMGLANFLMGSFNLQLFYELSNDRKSGNLPITIPLNVLNILTPMNLQTFEFKGLWDQIKSNSKYPNSLLITKQFSLDLQKAQNMAKLKQIISFGGTSFTQINDIEANAPNIVGFAAQLNRPQLVADTIWILIRLTLTKDGNNCTFEISGAKDSVGLTQNVANSVLSLIAKNQ